MNKLSALISYKTLRKYSDPKHVLGTSDVVGTDTKINISYTIT